MGDYMSSLRKLLKRGDEIYYPAHGPERRKPQGLVRGLLAHRRMREEAIYERVRSGDRRVADIVARVYADVDPRLTGAAALSTLAHLEHLMEAGRILQDGPDYIVA
jgi:glyoxylase-like metal-dependent hydrolase (beta-lactamase superfamily II)